MATLKDKYINAKEVTVNEFYKSFAEIIASLNNPTYRHDLKEAISDIKMNEESITLNFLHHKVILRYNVQINIPTTVTAFKEEINVNNYPNRILVPITGLDFQFSANTNRDGFRDYLFATNTYCVGNAISRFFTDYFNTMQTCFFPL